MLAILNQKLFAVFLFFLLAFTVFSTVVFAEKEKEVLSINGFRKILQSEPKFQNVRLLDIVNPNDSVLGTKRYRWCLLGSVPTEEARQNLVSLLKESKFKSDIEMSFSVRDVKGSQSKTWGKQEVMDFLLSEKGSAEFFCNIKYGIAWFLDVDKGIIWRSKNGDLDAKLHKDLIVVADRMKGRSYITVTFSAVADHSKIYTQSKLDVESIQLLPPRALVYNVAIGKTMHVAFSLIDRKRGGTNDFTGTLYCDDSEVRLGLKMSSETEKSENIERGTGSSTIDNSKKSKVTDE